MTNKTPNPSKPAVNSISEDKLAYWEKTVEWIFVRKYYKPRMFAAPLVDEAEGAGDVLMNFPDVKRWWVIEFKGNEKQITDEREKFPIFGRAKWVEREAAGKTFSKSISAYHDLVNIWKSNKNAPHLVVFGKIVEEPWFSYSKKIISQLSKDRSTKKIADELIASVSSEKKCWAIGLVGKSYWGSWCNVDGLVAGVPDALDVDLDRLKEYGWNVVTFKKYVAILLKAKALDGGDDGSGGSGVDWLFSTVMGVADDGTCVSFSLYEFAVEFGLISSPSQNLSQDMSSISKPRSGR